MFSLSNWTNLPLRPLPNEFYALRVRPASRVKCSHASSAARERLQFKYLEEAIRSDLLVQPAPRFHYIVVDTYIFKVFLTNEAKELQILAYQEYDRACASAMSSTWFLRFQCHPPFE